MRKRKTLVWWLMLVYYTLMAYRVSKLLLPDIPSPEGRGFTATSVNTELAIMQAEYEAKCRQLEAELTRKILGQAKGITEGEHQSSLSTGGKYLGDGRSDNGGQ